MQSTAFIYSLFGLVLGLGIAGILTGFAEALRIRSGVGRVHAEIRIGWLVPLLGALVIMDQIQFYIAAYEMRDAIPFTYFSLLSVLAVTGTYFLCSTFVFPDNPEEWADYDDYYMRVRRIVAGGVLAANVALLGFSLALLWTGHPFDLGDASSSALEMTLSLLFLPLLLALILVRSKRANLVVLALLNCNIVAGAVAPVMRALA